MGSISAVKKEGSWVTVSKLDEKEKDTISNEIRGAIGANQVKDDDVVLAAYGSDSSYVPFRKPGWWFRKPLKMLRKHLNSPINIKSP